MDDDFFRRDYDAGPQKRDNLFLWTVFILLLTGGVLACWLGSFYIFGHPENPRSYHILMKLHKIDAPKRFEYTAAPPGDFLTPQKLYEKYATMPDYQLQEENATLLRNYIRNYQLPKNPVPYLIGRFTILHSRELTSKDLFSSGMIALAQGTEYPQVLVEYVYTADPTNIEELKQILATGLEIKLEKTVDLSAIIHIEKLDDGRLLLTAVPLLYGTYTLKQGNGTFSLDPPSSLHLEGGIPIIKPSALPPPGRNYAATRPVSTPLEDDGNGSATPVPTPASEQLVRVMPPAALNPTPSSSHGEPASTPAVAQSTPLPLPVATAIPIPSPIARATPAPSTLEGTPFPTATPYPLARNSTPAPVVLPEPSATPAPMAVAPTPAPPPAATSPAPVAANNPNVPLQPFLEAQATPAVTSTAGNWKVFRPGQMPRGRLLKASDAADLADHGLGGERLYLSGQFTVTASGDNRAVLRPKSGVLSALNPLDHGSTPRIVVEFPAGYTPPAEGSTVSRDEMRPFEILSVQRGRDGTINVMVREVTTPE
jgi:hypothetical protein